jgi:hypothetical protein
MDKLARIVLLGIAAGLVVSIWGTVSHLIVSPLGPGTDEFFKKQDFHLILVTFAFNVALGFFYVAAYALIGGAGGAAPWRRLLSFWGVLCLAGVAPRALFLYRYLSLPDKYVIGWAVSWLAEALFVAGVVALLWPRPKAAVKAS